MGVETQTRECELIERGKDSQGRDVDFCSFADRGIDGKCSCGCIYGLVETGRILRMGCCLKGVNVGKYDLCQK